MGKTKLELVDYLKQKKSAIYRHDILIDHESINIIVTLIEECSHSHFGYYNTQTIDRIFGTGEV